jgi:hypothetical protein
LEQLTQFDNISLIESLNSDATNGVLTPRIKQKREPSVRYSAPSVALPTQQFEVKACREYNFDKFIPKLTNKCLGKFVQQKKSSQDNSNILVGNSM